MFNQEEEEFNSDNEYDPMMNQQPQQGMPHMAQGGILDENQPTQSLPPQLPPAPMPQPAPRPLPGMPQGVTAESPFFAAQKAERSRYGPEQQQAVEQALTKSRTGFLPNLANAGAGFADALMQGVARAGPSNFQANLQAQTDKTQEGIRGASERYYTGKQAERQDELKASENDPASPLSRIAQKAAMPTLKALGMSDEEIAGIPASLAAQAQTNRLSLEEIRAKAEETRALREQTGLYQQGMLENTRRGQAASEKNTAAGRQFDAAKGLSSRPWYQKATELIPPLKSEATKVMQEQLSNAPQFQTEEEAEAAGLPAGTEVIIAGRKARSK